MRRSVAILAGSVVLSACWHATIDTGRPPSSITVEKRWANSWILGLVPPPDVETASRCPNGVARVETQLSFLNQVVHVITFGIYTPMEIVVTCAAPGSASTGQPPLPVGEESRRRPPT